MKNFKFSTLEYKRPDLEARRAQLAAWKDAVERAESYDALRELLFEIDRVNCELFTQYSVAHIRHTLDTRDEFYEAEISYLQDTLPTLGGAEVALSEAIASGRFRADIEREFGKEYFVSSDMQKKLYCEANIPLRQQESRLKNEYQMLSGNSYLFPDSLKKALLLYLLKYGKALMIKSMTVKIDNAEVTEVFYEKAKPLIYSMINGDLQRNIPKDFSSDGVFNYLLKTPKSSYKMDIAALFAFLCSKSKEYETERFIYLWTSFNGMYNYLYDLASDEIKKSKQENQKIRFILKYFNMKEATISNADKNRLANEVISILKSVKAEHIDRNFIETTGVKNKIEAVLNKSSGEKYEITAYEYLIVHLAYHFRCKFIHGSKPVILFSYCDDNELHVLKIINDLLEEFIDDNLPHWLDEQYIEDVVKPRIKEIKQK